MGGNGRQTGGQRASARVERREYETGSSQAGDGAGDSTVLRYYLVLYLEVVSDTAAARSPRRQLGVLGAREIGADPRLPRLQEIGSRDQERLAVLGKACLDVS
jgi:hypothetical protein